MATRTIANGGGNWNTAGTWVEGAVPVAGDAVVATGTSGNLTLDVAAGGVGLLSLDLTGYTGVLAFGTNTLTVAGPVTFASTQGAMTGTTGALICNTTATLTSGGKTLPVRLELAGTSQTYTLGDAWTITGKIKTTGTTLATLNSSTASVAGGVDANTCPLSGSTVITMTGGTLQAAGGTISSSITLAGNITVSSVVAYQTGTLTYSSGTITVTSSTLNIVGSATINTSGMTWNVVRISGGTVTLNSALSATTLQINNPGVSAVFAGTAGFTVGTFTNNATLDANRTVTFNHLRTYTITTAFTFAGTTSFRWTLQSDDATLLAPFVLQVGATQSVYLVNATRLDSSAGQTIHSLGGVLNDPAHPTLNWDTPGWDMWLF